MSEDFVMSDIERRTSAKLIQHAGDALGAIALEEVVAALHRRFIYRWQWDAFMACLTASGRTPEATKDQP